MLKAIADGETNPTALAALADKKLRATQEQLRDALSACTELNSVYRRLLQMTLEELQFLEQQSWIRRLHAQRLDPATWPPAANERPTSS